MKTYELINLTGKDETILVGDKVVDLPSDGRSPSFIDSADREREEVEFTVGGMTTSIVISRASKVAASLGLPPERDGVKLLVKPHVLLRCPERNDLVVVSTYAAHGDLRVKSLGDRKMFYISSVTDSLPLAPLELGRLEDALIEADAAEDDLNEAQK